MTGTFGKKSLFTHQPCYPLACALNALGVQFGMDTWAPIYATIGLESRLDLLGKVGI